MSVTVIFAMERKSPAGHFIPNYKLLYQLTNFTLAIIVHFSVDHYIGQTVLCVGNINQTIVDCSVLEAFREYRDDLRDHHFYER